jgi:hypothetical protein
MESKLDVFYRVFNAYALPREGSIEKGDNMEEKKESKFTATARVTSNVPDPEGAFRDIGLHNENTDKKYKTRAWFNAISEDDKVILDSIKVGQEAKFTILMKLKEYNGKMTTFFNILAVDMPEIQVQEGVATQSTKPSGTSKDTHITNLALFKACTPFFSGNFQMFIDHMGGDFEAGLERMIQALFALYETAQKDIK